MAEDAKNKGLSEGAAFGQSFAKAATDAMTASLKKMNFSFLEEGMIKGMKSALIQIEQLIGEASKSGDRLSEGIRNTSFNFNSLKNQLISSDEVVLDILDTLQDITKESVRAKTADRDKLTVYEGLRGLSKQELELIGKKLNLTGLENKTQLQTVGIVGKALVEKRRLLQSQLDLNNAQSDYNLALSQAKADLNIQSLVMRLELTEQETSEVARLLALENKRKIETGLITGPLAEQLKLSGYLTAEQAEQLVQQNRELRHKRESVELTREIANLQLEAQEEIEKYTMFWEKTKSQMKAIATDPQLAKTIFGGLLIKKSVEAGEELVEIIGEFRQGGESVTQAFHSLGQVLSFNAIVLGQDTKGALEGLQSQIGDLNSITNESVDSAAAMAQAFGLSEDESGKLIGGLSMMPGLTQEAAQNLGKMTGQLAVSAGVKPGVVLKQMAANTEAVAKFSAKGGESFARAAVGAAKMGIEVSKIAAAAEGLLDFENSINKQMEASVLLGREINLDKARELALQGDLAGATEEMLRNVGSEAEFNKLNLAQRKALADTMGMSVEDLGKMVKHQNEFTDAQRQALQEGESLDEVLAKGAGAAGRLGKAFTTENLALLFSGMTALKGTVIQTKLAAAADAAWSLVKKGAMAILKGAISLLGLEKTQIAASTAAKNANAASNTLMGTTAGPAAAGTRAVGAAAGGAAVQMLALGAAVLMIGGGIAIAALGLAQLVQSFKDLSGEQAAAAVVTVLGLATAFYFMIPAIAGAGAAATAGAVGLLALGAAVLMIGVGIGLAALGMAQFALALKDVPVENILAFSYGLTAMAVGMLGLATALLLIGPSIPALLLLGVAVTAVGFGVKMAADGLQELAEKADGLNIVADSLGRIASNLGLIATSGIIALPVIKAITSLGISGEQLSAAPAKPAGEEEDKLDLLIEEIRGLRAEFAKGGVVNMDGRKVGEILRTAVNSSNIR